MRSFTNRRLFLGFTLVWVGLIAAVAFSFLTKNRLESSIYRVRHTHEVLTAIHKFEAEVTRIETDGRGFIITGDDEYIENVENTRSRVWDTYFFLQNVTQDNPAQQKRLNEVRALTERKLAFVNRIIALRRLGRGVEAIDLLVQKEGKQTMDRLRSQLGDMVNEENKLLSERTLQAEEFNKRSNLFIIASLIVSTIVGLLTILLYRRLSKDRDRSLQNIKEFSSLLEGVFDSSQSGIMVLKAARSSYGKIEDFEWVAVNDKACALTMLTAEEMLGHRLLKVSPQHSRNGMFNIYRSVLETGRPIELEQSFELRDGKSHWMTVSIAPIANGIAVTFSDITSRKEDGMRLENSEANLQALINNTAEEVWSVDRNLRVITANQAFRERDKPVETTEFWTRTLYRALNGERFSLEISVPNVEGTTKLMDYRFNPVIGTDGSISGVAVFGQDITEKRSVELSIRRQSQILDTMISHMPVVLFSMRRDGQLLSIEGKGLEVHNVDPVKSVGRNLIQAYPHHHKELSHALGGEPTQFFWTDNPDAPNRFFNTYLFPDVTGQGSVIGIALDITPMKVSERALDEAKRRAESASAFKTRFLANMSHEIRTPLSAILGFAEILRKEEQDRRHQEYLSHIESAGTTLLKLIGDILDLTKIEEGKMALSEESFHLEEVVSSMLHPYEFRAREKGIDFRLDFLGTFPPYLIGDAGKLIQVLVNLVGNALKFTKEGGVCVELQGFEVSDDNLLLLQVSVIDSGIGIPEEKQAQVFAAFTQADDSISREFGGSGLGLSIAVEMVKLLGGHLELDSPSGHDFDGGGLGTRFYFTVPLRIDHLRTDIPDSDSIHYKDVQFEGQYRILLVEDNPVNQRLGTLVLEGCGCEVIVASNGKEGIDAALGNDLDLVLMDVQMPILDGLSATRVIREMKQDLVIVGLSANVYKEDIDDCFASGMTDFLAKPYTNEKMLAMLVKHCPKDVRVIQPERSSLQLALDPHQEDGQPIVSLQFLKDLVGDDLNQVRSFVDAFRQVADEFLAVCQETDTMPTKEATPLLAKAAHKLKASVHMVGLDHLHPLLERIEDAHRLQGKHLVRGEVEQIRRHIEQGVEELDRLLLVS